MKAKLEIVALVLGFLGLFGTITVTALPTWKVSAFIGANLIIMEELWEGLWMTCYRHIDIKMQCKVYDSLLVLPVELQAARGLMCVSIALVFIALIVTACGIKRSYCCGDNMKSKNITLAFGGCLYLLSFLTTLIPVSWVGHSIIKQFYNPTLLDAQKRELGQAIFIGWGTSGVLLATGIILLFRYSKRRTKEEDHYIDAYLMEEKSAAKDDSVYLAKAGSSFHKFQEYV
ncbi:claudin-17-like [Cyprinodon tularosa]|uniref:claudin-17-like n=1 Tax=Cyprinodon variegatus TaxID=28743 RepID=UPI000742CAE0|nr:PREDICTED: claudin-17-like [Cyprinodon variegatus]XP_038150330.1 claudin-17-like [Cyprinodon tularosa]